MRRLVWLGLALGAACSDALEQDTTAGLVVAVVNSGANSVSCVDATRLIAACLEDLAPPSGTPTTLDAHGSVIVVPLGPANAVKVINFAGGSRVVALPGNSGATGVAIQDDSVAWVANPNLNSVTQVNYQRGDTATFAAGTRPQAVEVTDEFLFFVNSNLAGGQPAGPSSLTWLTRGEFGAPRTSGTIPLSCTNASFAALGQDGLLYVVCSGTAGAADGKLAIVDPVAREEVAVLNGLGESPGPAIFHPSGRLLIASRDEGILEVNTLTRVLTRGRGSGVMPGGEGVAGLALDPRGRVYAVVPRDCTNPGAVYVLASPPDYRIIRGVTVGVCPSAAALALLPLAL